MLQLEERDGRGDRELHRAPAWADACPARGSHPVKTTDDLLVLRSDVYALSPELTVSPQRPDGPPFVELEPRYYRLLDEFEARFPGGAPSLRDAERLVVHGDVTFERGVVVRGAVELAPERPERIAAGTVLGG